MSSIGGSSVSRLFDYFVIVGLDESSGSGLEVLQSYDPEPSSTDLPNWSPLEKSYKPKILAHYPDTVAENPFDHDAVRNLCLPSGLIFRTQKHGLESSFHPFVITRENGSRAFGFSNVFYEEVRSQHVISAIQTLQAMHLTELSTAKNYMERRAMQSKNFRNGSSSGGMQKGQRPTSGRSSDLSVLDDSNTRSLPRHFKLAAQKGSTSLSAVQNFYDSSKDRLYVTKGIALISPLPYVQLPKHFLTQLTRLIGSSISDLSLESYVHNILWDVPVPPPSRSLSYSSFEQMLILARPKPNELPLLDYSLGDLFRLLDVPVTLQLFTCILLENQILLYSKDLYRLMVVAECLTGLLFPFLWQHVYVPILPSTLHHFLDAPVPFIMGLHAQATECQEDLPAESNLCFVDIDGNRLVVPEDLPPFPNTVELSQEILSVLGEYGLPVRNHKSWPQRELTNRNWSYGKRRGRNVRKSSEGSWSQDSDSGMSSNEDPPSLNTSQINLSMTQSHQSDSLRGLLAHSSPKIGNTQTDVVLEDGKSPEEILKNLKLNNALRQIFFNRFVHIFYTYEHFALQPDQDNSRVLIHNFDKATFLSDQPDGDLPFLSRFLETQMFASFIDRKIASMSSGEMDSTLGLFEERIKTLSRDYGESLVRTPAYEPCRTIEATQETLVRRFRNPDIRIPLPKKLNSGEETFPQETVSSFPILSKQLLNSVPPQPRSRKLLRELSSGEFTKDRIPAGIVAEYPSLRGVFVPTETNSSAASIAQANWEFVKQLLQDCKAKTKRMLVEKMGGEEAVALGHGDLGLVGLEEKTLVGSLCDLLERIWAHGLHVKSKGRSPLWNYLTNYEEAEAAKDTQKPLDPQFLSPDLSIRAMELSAASPPMHKKENEDSTSATSSAATANRSRRVDLPKLKSHTISVATDMRNIQAIREIKTEIGYARAWIRLSLEKKVLSKHLRSLLSDAELLRGFYKRTAFLRSEEEREQFLYHILTLNAVDYDSFTNTYTNISLPYYVLVFPSRRTRTIPNLWIIVSGTLGETLQLHLPADTLEFGFQHKNLGLLLSVRIGHDDSTMSSKFHLDYVVIRNEVTGFTRKFPCGRWLGRDVEDGSTERLLLGEPLAKPDDEEQLKFRTPPRARSPSVPRRFYDAKPNLAVVQTALGEAVIRLVKYYAKLERDRGSLPVLLCGDQGLVRSLEAVFQYGFKSSRLFTRYYVWDYLLRVSEILETDLTPETKEDSESEDDDAVRSFVELTQKVQSSAQGLGKEGKFQLLICLSAREHLLHRLPAELASCPLTCEMYERESFLRDPHLLKHLIRALEPLDNLNIRLDNSLSKGIE